MSYRDPQKRKEYSRARYLRDRDVTLVNAASDYKENREDKLLRVRGNHLRQYFKGCDWREALQKYDTMFALQNGVCAICREAETKIDRQRNTVCRLAVDHHYGTGAVRGLLCFRCNTNLGRTEKYFRRTMIYLMVGVSSALKAA